MGFTRGYSLGEEAGWRDGYAYGVRRGAQIAAEIGFYQGFVHAWICILEKDESSKQRKLIALKSLLELTRSFHRTNLHEDDSLKKLESIRAKFKQVKSLLNCGFSTSFGSSFDEGEASQQPPQPPPQQQQQVPTGLHQPAKNQYPHPKIQKCTEMSF